MNSHKDKSTVDEIRLRFDDEVERFSNLETGQQALPDAPLVLELIATTAHTHLQPGDKVLDLGCGAGNLTLRVMKEVGALECHLVDLSPRMLERATQRVTLAGAVNAFTYQADMRALDFEENTFDAIFAAASLHHLRGDEEWLSVFSRMQRWLKPGGRLYVSDFVVFDDPKIHEITWARYGAYLAGLGGEEYRDKVFGYIEKEDTPRSLSYQLELIRKVGFSSWDVLHRNGVLVAYFAAK
ncbi:MAG: methyltransferase domain-containing protein [Chthoniobacteraceae bacterium]